MKAAIVPPIGYDCKLRPFYLLPGYQRGLAPPKMAWHAMGALVGAPWGVWQPHGVEQITRLQTCACLHFPAVTH